MNPIQLKEIIGDDLAGFRLDQALAKLFPHYSRSQLQQWVENGYLTIDGKTVTKNRQLVFPGQQVELIAILKDKDEWEGEAIPLDILYEDESLFVINKPPGLIVHPGAGNPKSTLVNALLHYDKNLSKLPRAGLIHRLDKDTSGLLLVARTLEAQNNLSAQMQEHKIHRIYHAIVKGLCQATGKIDLPIGRHPTQRTKMAVLRSGGKIAITHYHLLEKFQAHSYLEIKLETGRTHQIRVHMSHIGHPVLGDPTYGKKVKNSNLSQDLAQLVDNFTRQALHAKKIIFTHPKNHESYTFESPLPSDFQILLEALRRSMVN